MGHREEVGGESDVPSAWVAPHVVPLLDVVDSEKTAAMAKSKYFSNVMGMYIATNSIC